MSDLLRRWLNDEVRLAFPVQHFEAEFASGYAFGELLHKCQLCPEFPQFSNRGGPDAMINNYTRLQPALARMGVTLTPQTVSALMSEERGVAPRLLYNIKMYMDGLAKELWQQKKGGSLARTLTSDTSPTLTLLESQKAKATRSTYDETVRNIFDRDVRLVATNPNRLMEALATHRYVQDMATQLHKADVKLERLDAAATSHRDTRRQELLASFAAKQQQRRLAEERAVARHAADRDHWQEMERQELRVELALQAKADASALGRSAAAAHDARDGIGRFETTLRQMGKDAPPAELSLTELPVLGKDPLEHIQKIRRMLPDAAGLAEAGAAYLATVKTKKAEDAFARRERERRRRKAVLEQQRAQQLLEDKADQEALLAALQRQSAAEAALASRLWQLRQEKEAMTAARGLRETQYAERRLRDYEEALAREQELSRAMKEEYNAAVAAEMERWEEADAARRAAAAAEQAALIADSLWGIIGLAERCADYREASDALVPRKEYREWVSLYVSGAAGVLTAPLVTAEVEAEAVPEPASVTPALDAVTVGDYLAATGEWDFKEPLGSNAALGAVVDDLAVATAPGPVLPPLPDLHLPLKLALIGTPFGGKTTLAQRLADAKGLKYIDAQAVIDGAIQAADLYDAAQAQASAEAAAAPPAPTPPPLAEDAPPAEPPLPPPGPPEHVSLGMAARQALLDGEEVPDAVVVRLIVLTIDGAKAEAEAAKEAHAAALAAFAEKKPKKGAPVEEPPAPVIRDKGFVLDGFPRTASQASLLERSLTGLDLEYLARMSAMASKLAPPPEDSAAQKAAQLHVSGLDAVIQLTVGNDAVALGRVLGRRVDPGSGAVYHVEAAPPPTDQPGLMSRLKEGASDDDTAWAQARFAAAAAESAPLEAWLHKFKNLLRPVDAADEPDAVYSQVEGLAAAIQAAHEAAWRGEEAAAAAAQAAQAAADAAAAAAAARTSASDLALALITTKKAEIEALVLLGPAPDDPAAAELVKGRAAEAAAELLVKAQAAAKMAADAAEAAAAASRAAEEAIAAVAAAAEDTTAAAEAVEATKRAAAQAAVSGEAAEAAAQAAAAAQAEAQAVIVSAVEAAEKLAAEAAVAAAAAAEEATKNKGKKGGAPKEGKDAKVAAAAATAASVMAPAEEEPLSPPALGHLDVELADILYGQWTTLEGSFLAGLRSVFRAVREERSLALAHAVEVKRAFVAFLRRPDSKQAVLDAFQREFNAVNLDLRREPGAKAELVLRGEELRDKLWDICDTKLREAEAQRGRLDTDSWLGDHCAILAGAVTQAAQLELDRHMSTRCVLKDYYAARYGVPLLTPEQTAALAAPPLAATAAAAVPVSLPPEAPEWAASLAAFSLANGLKPGAALAAVLLQALKAGAPEGTEPEPEEDPKKGGKKDAGKAAPPKDAKKKDEPPEPTDPAAIAAKAAAAAASAAAVAAGARDDALLPLRLQRLAERALAYLVELRDAHVGTIRLLDEWTKQRYAAECSAVAALAAVVKQAAVAETELPYDLRLDGDAFEVDESQLAPVIVDPNRVPPPPPKEEPPPPAGAFSCRQLLGLARALALAAPSGLISLPDAAGVIAKQAPEDAGKGLPADVWATASKAALESMLGAYDTAASGYVDWRELLVSLAAATCPAVVESSIEQLLEAREALVSAAGSAGTLAEEALGAVPLWYQRPLEAGEYDRESILKSALFVGFSTPDAEGVPVISPLATLLYLCAQPELMTGLQRALLLVGAGPDGATPEQLYTLAYPCGYEHAAAVGRAPVTLESISRAVRSIKGLTVPGTEAAEAAEAAGGEVLLVTLEQLEGHADGLPVMVALGRYRLVTDVHAQLSLAMGA